MTNDEIIKKVELADFGFKLEKCINGPRGNTLDRIVNGSGPYHDESSLLLSEEEDFYIFYEYCIAPMAGTFCWEIFRIAKSQITEENGLKVLLDAVCKKWSSKS